MEKQLKQALLVTAFGVCLYAVLIQLVKEDAGIRIRKKETQDAENRAGEKIRMW